MAKKNKKAEAAAEEIVAEETVLSEEDTEPEAVTEEPVHEEPAETAEPAGEEETAENKAGVVSRPVNFRTGPSFTNAVIAELKPGANVVVSGTVAGDKGKWYKCVFDGRTGYVKATGINIIG